MSVEWDPYFYEKKLFSAMQPKEKDMEKVGAAFEEAKPIKFIVEIYTEISMDDDKTIQDEKYVLMKVPTAASDRGLEVVIVLKMEYCLSETMEEAPSKPSLIVLIPVKEIDPYSLISYVNKSLMRASDGLKELDGSSFGTKVLKALQPKGVVTTQNPIPALMGCCMIDEKHLDCFNEGHQPNSHKRWLIDEIINFLYFAFEFLDNFLH